MRYKKLLAAILLGVVICFFICTVTVAQDSWTYDGYWWEELGGEGKLFFVQGYSQGLEYVYNGLWIGETLQKIEEDPEFAKGNEELDGYVKAMYDYYREHERLVGLRLVQILEGVDTFYGDFRNKSIHIGSALAVVVVQLRNKPEEEIEEFIRYLREKGK